MIQLDKNAINAKDKSGEFKGVTVFVDNENLQKIQNDITTINNQLGDLMFTHISQAEYDALESPDENTVYIITEGENDTE